MQTTEILSPDNLSVVDLAIQNYGSVEGLFLLLENNQGMNLDTVKATGASVMISPFLFDKQYKEPLTTIKRKDETVIQDGQNTVDLALQYYGSVEGLFQMLEDLGQISLDAVMKTGDLLKVSHKKSNQKMANWIGRSSIIINTGQVNYGRQFDDSFNDSLA